jgi:DNA-binding LacI/PurR family transcriptional regulator
MEDSDSPLQLRRQLEIIQQTSDAVVFIGPQFIHLKELVFQNNIPAVVISPQYSWGHSHLPSISYDQEAAFAQFAERLSKNGCNFLGLVSMHSPFEADRVDLELRQSMFRNNLAKKNIRVKDYNLSYSSNPSEAVYQELSELLAKEAELPDTFCGPHYPTVIALQQLIYKQNRKFNIVALTGGSIFSLIYPAVTYIRIPCIEMGRLARTTLINAVKKGEANFANQTVKANIWPNK